MDPDLKAVLQTIIFVVAVTAITVIACTFIILG
jgi:hypothetical protein